MLIALENEDWLTAAELIVRHFNVDINFSDLDVHVVPRTDFQSPRSASSILLYPVYGYRFEWHSDTGFDCSLYAVWYYSGAVYSERAKMRPRPALEVFKKDI